jgi:hypothetical protein
MRVVAQDKGGRRGKAASGICRGAVRATGGRGSIAQGETHSCVPVRLSNAGRGRGELRLGCVTYALPTRGAAVALSAV